MAVLERLEGYLKENKVTYKVIKHPEVYTAQEIAAAMHVPGKELAKVVMIKAKDRFVMTVIPASWRIDFSKLKEVVQEKDLRLATEGEFKALFPDCEGGAEPPFGNLYNMDTFVDKALTEDEHIFFNGGNHYEAVEMRYWDYAGLVKPRVAEFARHLH
ncbi:MAG: YbaK/EbsC family protein [Nitrospirae bacterium]|nr:YbaK/EbsC family protein [Nitrospirota bacterium]